MSDKKQLIISIGREYGSGGHEIGEKLADLLQIPLYDASLLEEIAKEKNLDVDYLKKHDEKPQGFFGFHRVGEYNNSPNDAVAYMQFNRLKEMADEGKSFVIIGRCSEWVLADYPAMSSFYIHASDEFRIPRVMETEHVDAAAAKDSMERVDRRRRAYHDYYCKGKWADLASYDLTVDSSKIGINGTVDLIMKYLKLR